MPPRDFDEMDDYENPHFRWVSMAVLLLAVAGFLSLAWYAYQTGAEHGAETELVVIEAENEPIKEVPADPGGMEFPHQDKTIYEVLDPEPDAAPVQVLEAPEEPDLPQETASDQPEPADRKVAQILQQAVEETQRNIRRGQQTEPSQAMPQPEPELDSKPKPEPVVEKPAPKAEPAVAKTEPVAAPVTPVKTPAVLSGVQAQLGAFRSEAEAQAYWNKLQASQGAALSGLSKQVVRADLGAKGIYYRLRATGFTSAAAATQLCAELAKQQLGCFVVK